VPPHVEFQPSLFDAPPPALDLGYSTLRRVQLDPASWVDEAPGWVRGSDALFVEILRQRAWKQRVRWMYERKLPEPRLTDHWDGESGEPLAPPLLEDMRRSLSQRYRVAFDSAGFNLYRDGRDSVAWHGDKIEKEIEEPIVALVSLGEPRKLLLRPRGGGRSLRFVAGRGDLLVMGGKTQRAWEHAVPKVARAGPRITVAFRYSLDPRAYAGKSVIESSAVDAERALRGR
jgi:alkylated DNA repair dioxygenase AlkB